MGELAARGGGGTRRAAGPDDLQGMKLRTMQTPMYVALFNEVR
jgi:TRAP-type C4-dicarboxylate transport system substrate-binding protein